MRAVMPPPRVALAVETHLQAWPIGSGNVQAGVKGFNYHIKGTEQFWTKPGVEAVMALHDLWMSQDLRWDRYWATPLEPQDIGLELRFK